MKIDLRKTYNKFTNWNTPIVKPSIISYTIIIFIIVFYCLFLASKGLGLNASNPALKTFLFVPRDFRPIALLPSSFIVINPLEIVFNIFLVKFLGRKIEDVLGYSIFLIMYLAGSALFTSLIFLFTPNSAEYFTAGSGAIAVLLGIYTALYPKEVFFFGSYKGDFPGGLYSIMKAKLWLFVMCWSVLQLVNYLYINNISEDIFGNNTGNSVPVSAISAIICLTVGYLFGRLFKENGYLDNYNEKYKTELEEKYAKREIELAGYYRIMKKNNPKYSDVQKEFVEEDGTIVDYIEKFCSRCKHYSLEEGACTKMYENVLEYPEKYNLCGSKYFVKI
ncbi:MAG: rhomboid family intramembrane serine protease [Ignavibacteriae bacterium]|nr:MAG: rhomboid family intramembrane serine protease [Ignavibacteriota bacterium]